MKINTLIFIISLFAHSLFGNYQSPSGGYSSAGGGYSSPPIYETTATLLVDNQPSSITGIPRPATGSTWYQSFTAENSAKLTKFAFATNGSFTATADVIIREGEGVAGNILHSGTWTGLGSNTNSFNEYEITNEVLLTGGQKYTIQLENQTAGGFIGSNPGLYNGGKFYYSGYSGEYGDLKMKIWGLLKATGNAIDIISPAVNDQNITDDNDTLTISYNYQSDSGGYQTPTWAYRIDSGFPNYGSPHGGTQVTGTRTKNDFLSGQTYGSKTVYVALLDQSGNLHNPPITLNRTLNYQSSGGGYQSPSGNTPNSTDGIELITNGDFNTNSDWTVQTNYSQTIQNGQLSLLRNGSNAEGTAQSINTVIGSTYKVIYNVVSVSGGYPRIYVGTTEDSDDVATLILSTGQGESSFTATASTSWIHPSVAGSTTGNITFSKISVQKVLSQNGNSTIAITSPGNGSQVTDSNDNLSVSITYQSSGGGYQTPTWAYRIGSGFPNYGSPHGGTQVTGSTTKSNFLNGQPYGSKTVHVALLDQNGNLHNPPVIQSRSFSYQSSGGGYQSGGGHYQSGGGHYQTPAGDTIAIQAPGNGSLVTPSNDNLSVHITYQSNGGGYQTPTWAYKIDSGFPAYGSPHGGTQVVGTTNRNDIFNGQPYGQRLVNVVLLDQSGNMHNPPITKSVSVNYQSTSGGYQSPGGHYQSPGSGFQTPNSGYSSPGDGYQSPGGQYQSPDGIYQSEGGNYQDPTLQPTVILRTPNGQIVVDQLNGKYRYRDLSGLTVWTVFQTQGTWQIRTGYNSQTLAYGTDGALEQFIPSTQDFGTPYLINSNGQYVWNPTSPFPTYYDIESVINGMITSNYYTVPTTSISGKSYLFLSKSQAEDFLASKNPKPVQSILKSFVETLGFSHNNGEFILTGRARQSVDSASSTQLNVGFLISPNATLDPLVNSTQKIVGQANSDGNFSVSVTTSNGQNQYFRAFAENEAGISYGKILKITPVEETDPTKQNPSEKALNFLASESNELAGGWLENEWFGSYKSFENGWIYHTSHGWLFLSADPVNGIWAWSPNRGWIWSTKELYPFLYQANEGNWIYFMAVREGASYYYNYFSQLMEKNNL